MKIILFTFIASIYLSITSAKPLISFATCKSFHNYMTSNAVKRVGPYGLGGTPFLKRGPFEFFALSDPAGESSSTTPTEGVDFSGTNVQVQGVDEPDIIKTDGKRVFVLKGNEFYYVESTASGMAGHVVANFTLPSYGTEMLFSGDYVYVIGRIFESVQGPTTFIPLNSARQESLSISRPRSFSISKVVLYKIFIGKSKVTLVQTLKIPGRYVSSRLVDNVIRLVTSYDGSRTIPFVYPNGNMTSEQATEENKKIIKNLKLSQWIPNYELSGLYCWYRRNGGKIVKYCRKYSETNPLSKCSSIYVPKSEFSGFSLLSVSTIRVSTRKMVPRSVSILADGDTVYSSLTSIYVVSTEYQFDFGPINTRFGSTFKSSFHKFSFLSSYVKYSASGEVSGSVLNQFSMHEYKNVFFIATTDGAPWWGSRDTSSSKVTAFKESGKSLVKTSEVGNLGVGERIYAVRYISDKAYVVTFEEIDPLYIIDLSNIYKLKATGELKIPGYSAYLHPIGGNKLLGVGRDVQNRRTTGAKVSLFDISDITNPTEIDNWILKGSYTNAEWDHRAFLYWAPEKIAVLPISVYSRLQKDRFLGSIILDIGDKISERGRISHTCCGSDFQRSVRRNFVLGKINLWSLSWDALQVNAISDLKTKINIPLKKKSNEK